MNRTALEQKPEPRHLIVCAAFNNVEMTKLTYQSLLWTSRSSRIVLVNNGSTDGTQTWMESESGRQSIPPGDTAYLYTNVNFGDPDHENYFPIAFINNPENGGCGIGRNIGLRLVQKDDDYITLIDNDVVLTHGWDAEMTHFMDQHPEVGICGPMTNFAGTPQLLDKTRHQLPQTLEEVEPFARRFRQENLGKWSYVPPGFVVIGFCMMIRRACYEQLKYPDGSLFDERFKLYGCEDNDLCVRAVKAGWRLAYFGGCYVHHWGSKSLQALDQAGHDWGKQWRENKRLFDEKWGSS